MKSLSMYTLLGFVTVLVLMGIVQGGGETEILEISQEWVEDDSGLLVTKGEVYGVIKKINRVRTTPRSFDSCGGRTIDCESFLRCQDCNPPNSFTQIVTECGTLDESDTTYVLKNIVESEGTCIIISGHGITLDCRGLLIKHGKENKGVGVFISRSSDVTVKNCVFNQLSPSALQAFSVDLQNSHFITIENNIINTKGGASGTAGSGGIRMKLSGCSKIHNNKIITDGQNGYGVFTERCTNGNQFVENNIITQAAGGVGLYFTSGNELSVTKNKITTSGSSGLGIICNQCRESTFNENGILTTSRYVDGFALYGAHNNKGSGNSVSALGRNGNAFIIADGSSNNVFKNSNLQAGAQTVFLRKAGPGNSVSS